MKDQLRETIDMFNNFEGNKIEEIVSSPAQKHLRECNDKCHKLNGRKSELFHSIVAKLLWIMKRARPDLEVAVSYLCTRVPKSDEYDWEKLRRVLAFV